MLQRTWKACSRRQVDATIPLILDLLKSDFWMLKSAAAQVIADSTVVAPTGMEGTVGGRGVGGRSFHPKADVRDMLALSCRRGCLSVSRVGVALGGLPQRLSGGRLSQWNESCCRRALLLPAYQPSLSKTCPPADSPLGGGLG